MRECYGHPVGTHEVALHGDFRWNEPSVTVIRVKNFQCDDFIPVVTCKDPEAFKAKTGLSHTPEGFVRSLILENIRFHYDVEEVNWGMETEVCEKALEDNDTLVDYDILAYEELWDLLDSSTTHHYEFDLPEEMVLIIPRDMNEAQFAGLTEEVFNEILDNLAWQHLISTLPVTNIREVPNK